MTIQSKLLELASRTDGVRTGEMLALGFDRETISRAAYYLSRSGRIHGFKCAGGAAYYVDQDARDAAKTAWHEGKDERLRALERARYAKKKVDPEWMRKKSQKINDYRKTKRAADIEAGILPPPAKKRPKPKPRQYKVVASQKPCFPATVNIKTSGRGPAYLPGEPLITSKTRFTYGVSPMNPSRTNTHAE